MLVIGKKENNKLTINDVRVLQEYPEVFHEELPSMPPKQEVKFTIDLTPNFAFISKAPYRMTPKELQELKSQIEQS